MPDVQTAALPATDSGRWIVVSLPAHTLQVKEDGSVTREIDTFATGRLGHLTPIVNEVAIPLNLRFAMYHSHTYNNAPMPYALFFDDGCAFHEGNTGVESHGCVHLSGDDAKWLYEWAGQYPVNVQVQGPQCSGPNPGLGPQAGSQTPGPSQEPGPYLTPDPSLATDPSQIPDGQ